jgi:hypothetical protein
MLRVLTQLTLLLAGRRIATFVVLPTFLFLIMVLELRTPRGLPSEEPDPAIPIPVQGAVTYHGQPVGGAVVSFLPLGDLGRHGAFGMTGPDGSLHLSTYTMGDGALPGIYKVLVRKGTFAPAPGTAVMNPATLDEELSWQTHTGMMMLTLQTYKSLLPSIYGDVAQTPLRCNVPGDAPVAFDLQGEPAP